MAYKAKGLIWGGALLALPLLFPAALGAFSSNYPVGLMSSGGNSGGSIEASWLSLALNRDQINEASSEASAASHSAFPGVSDASMQLWGGGVMAQKGASRFGAIGMSGAMASDASDQHSNFGLDLVGLIAEQRYPGNSWEATAGFFVGYGQFDVEYRDNASYSRFESRFVGSGGTAGARWPTTGRLSFFIRSGYLWLPASGSWHGTLSGRMAKTYFDLSAPFGQAGMDLMF